MMHVHLRCLRHLLLLLLRCPSDLVPVVVSASASQNMALHTASAVPRAHCHHCRDNSAWCMQCHVSHGSNMGFLYDAGLGLNTGGFVLQDTYKAHSTPTLTC